MRVESRWLACCNAERLESAPWLERGRDKVVNLLIVALLIVPLCLSSFSTHDINLFSSFSFRSLFKR